MARKSSTTIRITEQSRQELKNLAAKMRISQAAVMELLIRDKYQQEIKTMNDRTYYISADMLGDEGTEQDARRMVEILIERGYDVEIGHPRSYQGDDDIAKKDWEDGLDIISHEKYAV